MKPVYVKTADTRLAGLERRVRFLERRSQTPEPVDAADGIRFDVPNIGHGLSIETHDGGIFLDSHGDGATLEIQAHDDGSIEIRSHGGPITIASAGGAIDINSSGGGVTIDGTPFP